MKRYPCLIAYDISDDARRRQVYRILTAYFFDAQKSVFPCLLSPREQRNLLDQVAAWLTPADRFLLARLQDLQPLGRYGTASLPDYRDELLIVG